MRLVLFYLLLLLAQGVLGLLLAPLPAPDFFLLAVLTLLWRLSPWQLVLTAYGLGLLQDVLGYGTFGMHALGLAGAALAALLVKGQLSQNGTLERLVTMLGALVGKWIVFVLSLWWMGSLTPFAEALRVAPLETLFTMLVGLWILPYAERLMDKSSLLRKELL